MSRKYTGGPAFPEQNSFDVTGEKYSISEGMTLRDYFAANAPFTQQDAIAWADSSGTKYAGPDMVKFLAYLRYQYADAMLAERA